MEFHNTHNEINWKITLAEELEKTIEWYRKLFSEEEEL